jgi:hypothetical protein
MFWKIFKQAPVSMITYPLYALVSWTVTLLSFALSPLIAGISMVTGKKDVGGPLSYFYTHNASLDGGVEQGVKGYDKDATGLSLFWQRVCWICRNPGYKFGSHVLGFKGEGSKVLFNDGVWSIVQSPKGNKYFGYRDPKKWLGWSYKTYAGYHQLKSKPYSFK